MGIADDYLGFTATVDMRTVNGEGTVAKRVWMAGHGGELNS